MRRLIEAIRSIEKKYIVMAIIIILAAISFIVYKIEFNSKLQYVINSGYIEKVSENQGILALSETVINIDTSTSIIPIIEEGKRTSNNEVVATYKNKEYEDYIQKIEKMDLEIETLINDLPLTYSSDVSAIDKEISEISIKSMKTSSYVKMQEYKKKIDELCKKKVSLLSDLSPDGSKIRELTSLRNQYENESKNSGNNIRATSPGIVSYKIDSLENSIDINKIYDYGIEDINRIYNSYSGSIVNNFGMKIIDNYKAYLILKEKRGVNDEYIEKNKKYVLRAIDNNYFEISGKIVNFSQDDEFNYIIFEITDNIENIYESRMLSVEVIWKKIEGLVLPIKALKYNEQKNYYYVITLKYGEYTEIPVEVRISSDTLAIIKNMEDDKIQELGLKDTYKIKLYDRIIIE